MPRKKKTAKAPKNTLHNFKHYLYGNNTVFGVAADERLYVWHYIDACWKLCAETPEEKEQREEAILKLAQEHLNKERAAQVTTAAPKTDPALAAAKAATRRVELPRVIESNDDAGTLVLPGKTAQDPLG